MKCEIINPSDKVFIEHRDKKTLFKAVLLLGRGQYGAKDIDGDFKIPVFLFGGVEEYCQETFGLNFELIMAGVKVTDLVDAFRSVSMNHERTSLNDIVGLAQKYADKYEEEANNAKDSSRTGEGANTDA
jgi:hypothetical protein